MDRLFFDTEFTALTDDAKLISIGLIDESGRHTFYAELADTWQPEDGWLLRGHFTFLDVHKLKPAIN